MSKLLGEEWGLVWYHYFMALILVCSITWVAGGFEVIYMRTIGVEKENARHEVFQHSNAHISGMERDGVKLLREFNKAKTQEERNAVRAAVRLTFKDFDEDLMESGEVISFVKECKYH